MFQDILAFVVAFVNRAKPPFDFGCRCHQQHRRCHRHSLLLLYGLYNQNEIWPVRMQYDGNFIGQTSCICFKCTIVYALHTPMHTRSLIHSLAHRVCWQYVVIYFNLKWPDKYNLMQFKIFICPHLWQWLYGSLILTHSLPIFRSFTTDLWSSLFYSSSSVRACFSTHSLVVHKCNCNCMWIMHVCTVHRYRIDSTGLDWTVGAMDKHLRTAAQTHSVQYVSSNA